MTDFDYETRMSKAQEIIDVAEYRFEHGMITMDEFHKEIAAAIDEQLKAKAWRDEVKARSMEWSAQMKDERPR